MKKIFECYSHGGVVECSAPVMCHQECRKYNAKRVTGIKTRTLKSDCGASITATTGFVDGGKLVIVQ